METPQCHEIQPPAPVLWSRRRSTTRALAPIFTDRPSLIAILASPTTLSPLLHCRPQSPVFTRHLPVGLTPFLTAGGAVSDMKRGPAATNPSGSLFYTTLTLLAFSTVLCIAIAVILSTAVLENGFLVPMNLPFLTFDPSIAHVLAFACITITYGIVFACAMLSTSRKLAFVALVFGTMGWLLALWTVPFLVHSWPESLASAIPVVSAQWDPMEITYIRQLFQCTHSSSTSAYSSLDDHCLATIAEAVHFHLAALRALIWLEWSLLSLSLILGVSWSIAHPTQKNPVP